MLKRIGKKQDLNVYIKEVQSKDQCLNNVSLYQQDQSFSVPHSVQPQNSEYTKIGGKNPELKITELFRSYYVRL